MQHIDLTDTPFKKLDISKFLLLLFKDSSKVSMVKSNNTLIVSVKDDMGKVVRKTLLPVNIKRNDTLGWYSDEYKLCLMPLNNGDYVLRYGCGTDVPIRSLNIKF